MLVLTRRPTESFVLIPSDDIGSNATLADFFSEGPIEIKILGTQGNHAKIRIRAPLDVKILRSELYYPQYGMEPPKRGYLTLTRRVDSSLTLDSQSDKNPNEIFLADLFPNGAIDIKVLRVNGN
ncbi:MAG: carbon storage regulator, partial [bacterium]|nr:carbon storage regulator [bacterium]